MYIIVSANLLTLCVRVQNRKRADYRTRRISLIEDAFCLLLKMGILEGHF